MLVVKDLWVSYEKRIALQRINFSLEQGKVLGVIGPNGAGKTTLIRALSGTVKPGRGTISINGTNIAAFSPSLRARQMGVVPQAKSLPAGFTGLETVLMGRTPYLNWLGNPSQEDEAVVRSAMERTDTLDLAGRRIGELSGGEQQSLLLARALAQSAPVLLLDEPTTHLDLRHQIAFLDLIRKLVKKENLTVVAALHDLNLVSRFADVVIVLVKGDIQAMGSLKEIMRSDILQRAFDIKLSVVKNTQSKYPVIVPPDPSV